ncbi:MAG: CAP domain-containing protein [Dehalococcoidia bacterium]
MDSSLLVAKLTRTAWVLALLLVILLIGTACTLPQIPQGAQQPKDAAPLPALAGPADPAAVEDSAKASKGVSTQELSQEPAPASLPTRADRTSAPTPVLDDSPEQAELREYMLGLINHDRVENGLPPVVLGSNTASQKHAEDKLQHGYSSHWGRDGLKPYMRYTRAGGADYESENVADPVFLEEGINYIQKPPKESLAEAQVGLMNSPGHRRNILNRWHKKVNLGIACTDIACSVVQQFQGDYVEFDLSPEITDGFLSFSGTLKDGFEFQGVQVWWDPPPHSLTLGQLDATHSYGMGIPAVFIRQPLLGNSFYPEDSSVYAWTVGVDPYRVDPDTPRAEPVCQGDVCTYPPGPPTSEVSVEVPWVTAAVWQASGGSFGLGADISETVSQLGAGVYTIAIWGVKGNESVSLTRYSVFLE